MDDGASSVGSYAASAVPSEGLIDGPGGANAQYGDATQGFLAGWITRKLGFQDLLHDVLYPVSKIKYSSRTWYAVCFILLEFTQLSAYYLNPVAGFDIGHSFWVWEYWRKSQMWIPTYQVSFSFYLVVFYAVVVVVCATTSLIYYLKWEALQSSTSNSRKVKWGTRVVRALLGTLFSLFFISTLGIVVGFFDCLYEGPNMEALKLFPNKKCTEMPYLAHGMVGFMASILFLALSYLNAHQQFDNDPLTHDLLATTSPIYPIKAMCFRAAAVFLPLFIDWHTMLHGIALMGLYATWLRCVVNSAPYYSRVTNKLYAAIYATLLWGALVVFVRGIIDRNPSNTDTVTILLLAGAAPAAIGGWALMSWRIRRPRMVAAMFVRDPGLAFAKDQFMNTDEVMIASQCMRVRNSDEMIMQDLYKGAESVLNSGQNQFRLEPALIIAHCNFLVSVRGEIPAARKHYEEALKIPSGTAVRFQIYSALQNLKELQMTLDQHEGGARSGAGGNYADFQKQLEQAMRYHRVVIDYNRAFWKELSTPDPKLKELTKWMSKMEGAENRAHMTYMGLLKQHPKSTRLMRIIAGYLEDISKSPSESAALQQKADDLENEAEEKQREMQLQSLSVSGGGGKRDTSRLAEQSTDYEFHEPMFVITRFGIIREANKAANRLFGYSKGEVIGKNVSILMPAPFSTMHNSFLRNYCLSGVARIIGSDRDVVAMHKDRHIFPVTIQVNAVEFEGEELFAGVITPKEEDPSMAVLYATANGVVLCANRVTREMLGYETADVVGKQISDFTASVDEVFEQAEIELANFDPNAKQSELDEGKTMYITFIHKFKVNVPVHLRVRVGGTSNHKILILEMRQEGGVISGIATLTQGGRVEEASKAFADLAGHSRSELVGSEIFKVMPKTYAPFHKKWLQKSHGARTVPNGCKAGRLGLLHVHGGTPQAVHIKVADINTNGKKAIARRGRRASAAGDDDKTAAASLAVLLTPVASHAPDEVHTAEIMVDQAGVIQTVEEGARMLGPDEAATQKELVGKPVSSLIRITDKRLTMTIKEMEDKAPGGEAPTWLGVALNKAAKTQAKNAGRPLAWRASLKPSADAACVPAAVVIDRDGDDRFSVRIHKIELVDGFMDVELAGRAMIVKKIDPGLTIMFGWANSSREAVGRPVNEVLTEVSGDTEDLGALVGTKISSGGSKEKTVIGPKRATVAAHQDGEEVKVFYQSSLVQKKKKGGKVLVVRINGCDGCTSDPVAIDAMWGVEGVDARDVMRGSPAQALRARRGAPRGSPRPGGSPPPGSLGSQGDDDDDRGALKLLSDLERRGEGGPAGEDDDANFSDPGTPRDPEDGSPPGGGSPRPGGGGGGPAGGSRIEEWIKSEMRRSMGRISETDVDAVVRSRNAPRGSFEKGGSEEGSDDGMGGGGDGRFGTGGMGGGGGGGGGPPALEHAMVPMADRSPAHTEENQSSVGGDDTTVESESQRSANDTGNPANKTVSAQSRRRKKVKLHLDAVRKTGTILGLRRRVLIVVATLFVTHVVSFAVLMALVEQQTMHTDRIKVAGRGAVDVIDMTTLCRVLHSAAVGGPNSHAQIGYDAQGNGGLSNAEIIANSEAHMNVLLDRIEVVGHVAYLKSGGDITSSGLRLFEDDVLPIRRFEDHLNSTRGTEVRSQTGLWHLMNEVVRNGRIVASGHHDHAHAPSSAPWLFLMNNNFAAVLHALDDLVNEAVEEALDNASFISTVMWGLLVLEGGIVIPLCVFFLFRLLRRVSYERHRIMNVFVHVPRPTIHAILNRKVNLDNDMDDKDGEDEEEKMDRQRAKWEEAKKKNSQKKKDGGKDGDQEGEGADEGAGSKIKFNSSGKVLKGTSTDVYMLGFPLLIWMVVVMAVHVYSYFLFEEIPPLIRTLAASDASGEYIARTVFYANELVLSGPGGVEDPTLTNGVTPAANARLIGGEYARDRRRALLQGVDPAAPTPTPSPGDGSVRREDVPYLSVYGENAPAYLRERVRVAAEDSNQQIQDVLLGTNAELEAAVFRDAQLADLFYRYEGCLRTQADTCYADTHNYYPFVNNGIDNMLKVVVEQAHLLSLENDQDLNIKNRRFDILWNVANNDMGDALLKANDLIQTIASQPSQLAATLAGLLLAALLVGSWLFYHVQFLPFIEKTNKHVERSAVLLSQMPGDFNVMALLKEHLRKSRSPPAPPADGGIRGKLQGGKKPDGGPGNQLALTGGRGGGLF